MPTHSLPRTILTAGLLAGTLDLFDPIIFYGLRFHTPPIRIPQSVASGLLGRASFRGGWHTALLGVALHLFIASCWAAAFVLVARQLPVLRRQAVIAGLLYGGFVYCVMNFVVLPLSRSPRAATPPATLTLINGVLAIVLLVGLSIALVTKHFLPLPPVS